MEQLYTRSLRCAVCCCHEHMGSDYTWHEYRYWYARKYYLYYNYNILILWHIHVTEYSHPYVHKIYECKGTWFIILCCGLSKEKLVCVVSFTVTVVQNTTWARTIGHYTLKIGPWAETSQIHAIYTTFRFHDLVGFHVYCPGIYIISIA